MIDLNALAKWQQEKPHDRTMDACCNRHGVHAYVTDSERNAYCLRIGSQEQVENLEAELEKAEAAYYARMERELEKRQERRQP